MKAFLGADSMCTEFSKPKWLCSLRDVDTQIKSFPRVCSPSHHSGQDPYACSYTCAGTYRVKHVASLHTPKEKSLNSYAFKCIVFCYCLLFFFPLLYSQDITSIIYFKLWVDETSFYESH